MTRYHQLLHHLHHSADRVAFAQGDARLTFGELARRARCHAAALQAIGVHKGDRVAVYAGTSLELIVALLGNYLAGAVHLPINTRYRDTELAHILEDSEARVLLYEVSAEHEAILAECDAAAGRVLVGIGQPTLPGARSLEALCAGVDPAAFVAPAIDDEDAALMLYTSGTTGRSKGVVHSFRSIVANITALTALWRFVPEDRLVLALPLYHVHGLGIGVHGTLINGNQAELLERFDAAEVVDAIARGGTVFMGVPTMYALLLEHLRAHPEAGATLAKARLFTAGSAALPAAHFAAFERHTGHRILERYGMTETLLTVSNPYEGERRPGAIGLAVPGCEVRIVDEAFADVAPGERGELVVRGDSLMTGYWRRPDADAASFRDGWFLTGDLACADADGYLHHLGRKSVDLIKSAGWRISAREIEDVLRGHEAVADVAVVGLADETWGQVIAAAVTLRQPCADIAEQLVALAEAHLADYKKPRRILVLDALPRNALGKVQKHRLVELFDAP